MRLPDPDRPDVEEYLKKHNVEELLVNIIHDLCDSQPENVIDHIIDHLQQKKQEEEEQTKDWGKAFSFLKDSDDEIPEYSENEEAEDSTSEDIRRRYSYYSRRDAFSAEPLNFDDFESVDIPKDEKEMKMLKEAMKDNILFSHLDDDEKEIVFRAMDSQKCDAGEIVIKQGDQGDYFYVIDNGVCEVHVENEESNESKLVKTLYDGDSFGELALMHGKPRAATVTAKTDCKLWALGRSTFQKALAKQTSAKRERYSEFLADVPILKELDRYERLTVCDALVPREYEDGEIIVKQGDRGDTFYIIESGEVIVYKEGPNGERVELGNLGASAYFGEMALLLDQPRAATVQAKGQTKCLALDKKSVDRLLGPCEHVLSAGIEKYETPEF
eukprot:gb/GECH01014294.1/.p1 GENE.gb/GECH01014294.1/~~gb/GECH01014294.1/.p1  ORF type:complete len:386 (+),score=120.79 gb/GECH01014294.1/:1-1158(+)